MNNDVMWIKGASDTYTGVDTHDTYSLYVKWRRLSAPEVKTSYDEIPGANGKLDTTEQFGEVLYHNRILEVQCVYIGDNWYSMFETFCSKYHGQEVSVYFSNDSTYYHRGRLFVSNYDAKSRTISMTVDVNPYKLKRTYTTVVADPENGSVTKTLTNGRMKVMPSVTIYGAATVAWGGTTKALSSSSYPRTYSPLAGLVLQPNSETQVTVSGSRVDFQWREGAL